MNASKSGTIRQPKNLSMPKERLNSKLVGFGSTFVGKEIESSKSSKSSCKSSSGATSTHTMTKINTNLAYMKSKSKQSAHPSTLEGTDEFIARVQDTELKQLVFFRQKLNVYQIETNKRAEVELQQAWKTVYDAEEEATSLQLKAKYVKAMMEIHSRLMSLDILLQKVRSELIRVGDVTQCVDNLAEYFLGHIIVQSENSRDSGSASFNALCANLKELVTVLTELPGIKDADRIIIDNEIIDRRAKVQQQLNDTQKTVIEKLSDALDGLGFVNRPVSPKRSQKQSTKSSPHRSPY